MLVEVAALTVFLSKDNGWDEADAEFDLLWPRQHFIVQQNRQNTIPRRGEEGREVETAEPVKPLQN